MSTLTTREVARDKKLTNKYLGNIAMMKFILVTLTFGLIALTICGKIVYLCLRKRGVAMRETHWAYELSRGRYEVFSGKL